MPKVKFYTSKEIHLKFLKLPCPKQADILYNALGYMQEYNGRSKVMCVAMAMGYENTEGNDDTYFKSENS